MSSYSDFWNILDRSEEIKLTVKGRKSGKNISRPVWFVHEDKIVYLLPVNGSDTEWYKNVLHNPSMKISVNKNEFLSNLLRKAVIRGRINLYLLSRY